ncbi:MAG: TonB-dependent receptor plug domain-containing protein, partial [Nitrospirota bacterium]|nr:TonB-dependent receptor plug domain-containing protein [Nitrospirota bacterium]
MFFSRDELVITPTRTLKPLSQTAENISVVTAEDIENMNAHTLSEVLDLVAGVFVDFQGHDFIGASTAFIQGSDARHVLFLLDGVTLNTLGSGETTISTVPVGIIKRIEIIKGPASSVWGSALGGVINIVTKDPGATQRPEGIVSASYGKNSSQDYRADVSGTAGKAGYYIYAGRTGTDGLKNNRDSENNIFYAKLHIPLSKDSGLKVTAGYNEPFNDYGLPGYSVTTGDYRSFFTTASFSSGISNELNFEADIAALDTGLITRTEKADGTYFREFDNRERKYTGSARLIYSHDMHTAVIGLDAADGRLEQRVETPAVIETAPESTKWAIFANDTISLGRLAI